MNYHGPSWPIIGFVLLLVILGRPLFRRGYKHSRRWGVLPVLLLGLVFLSYAGARHHHSTSAVFTRRPVPVVVSPVQLAEVPDRPTDTTTLLASDGSGGSSNGIALPRASRRLEDWSGADRWPASPYSTIERAGQALADQVAAYLVDNAPDDVESVTVVASSARRLGRHREMGELVPIAASLRSLGWTDVKVHLRSDSTVDSTAEDFWEEREEEATDVAPSPPGRSLLPSVPSMPKLPLNGTAKDWERYGRDMERWGDQLGKHMDEWGQQLGKRFENFGEHMDELSERLGKRYETFSERIATEAERHARETAERVQARIHEKIERIKKERSAEKPKTSEAKQLSEAVSKPASDRVEQDQAGPLVRLVLRDQRSSGGWLRAAIRLAGTEGPEKRIQVRYVNEPWVRENRYHDSRGRRYVIGRSDLEPTSNEALRRANEEAIRQVRALLEARLEQQHLSPADRIAAQNRIPSAVARFVDEHRADEFCQELHSRRVDVHRAAVLVRADDGLLASTVDDVVHGTRVARKSFLQQMAGGGVLGVFLLLAYFFLNAGTKGHFAWKLRTVCAGAYAILCWAIFHFGLFS